MPYRVVLVSVVLSALCLPGLSSCSGTGDECCSNTGDECPHPDSVHPDTTGQIPWEQAVQVLLHCDVVKVIQTHDLRVRIELADGTKYSTDEPEIDAVLHLLSEHDLLGGLEYWTE